MYLLVDNHKELRAACDSAAGVIEHFLRESSASSGETAPSRKRRVTA